MDKRTFLAAGASVAAVSLLASGCTTTGSGASDPETRRTAINGNVDRTLSNLYGQVRGSEELVKSARGVLVFPNVVSAGFIIGAGSGEGALRQAGKTTSFHRTTSLSAGLLAGAQSASIIYLFMTQDALARFIASNGWQVGVDASVTLVAVGANATVDSRSAQQPIIAFVLNNAGLMVSISLDGARISRLDL